MMELANIKKTLDKIAPDEVYNLAGKSFVAASFEQPIYTSNVNALSVMHILEYIRYCGTNIRFYQASSSEMFGKVQSSPQTEETPFWPRSPYGVSKLFGHWATVNYRESFGVHASSGILFNHESPMRSKDFVTRKITSAFAEIALNLRDCLELGNLNAQRDWGFAGDYVEGMWLMLQQDKPDDYILATGLGQTVRTFAEQAARELDWEIEWSGTGINEVGLDRRSGRTLVRVNPDYYRPAEVDHVLGDPTKAEQKLGWRRRVNFDGLVQMMVRNDVRELSQRLGA